MPVEPKSLANLCWICCVNLNSEFPFTSACAGLPSPNSCGSMWVVFFFASIPAWPRETETSYTIPDIVSRLQAQACKVLTHWVLCECASIPVAKRDGNAQTDSRFCLAAVPKVLTHVFHTWNPQNPLSKIKKHSLHGFQIQTISKHEINVNATSTKSFPCLASRMFFYAIKCIYRYIYISSSVG